MRALPRLRVVAYGRTDVGLVRNGNEDSFAVHHDLRLYMVADGMGGAAAGEVASWMAIDCVREAFADPDATWPPGERPADADGSVLVAGIQRANAQILNLARREADKRGMATTFAGLLVCDDRVFIAHVGDSRVYRLRGQRIDLLTEDHSLLNALIKAGRLDPADAETFPHKNIITRAVGFEEALTVETRVDVPESGDVYLVCSDGLHGVIDDDRIASVLIEEEDVRGAVRRLLDLANERGGPDNITAVAVRVVAAEPR
jgi:protein phosphatase